MFVVIYSFEVKPENQNKFIDAWSKLTLLFRDYAFSLGSRLHRETDNNYIAYAQWPDKYTWESSNTKLPYEASILKDIMNDACAESKILYKLEVINDLLKHNNIE